MVSSRPAAVPSQGDVRLARPRMRGGVAQGLLGDAVQAERHVLRDVAQAVGGSERDRERVLPTKLRAMRLLRRRPDRRGAARPVCKAC